MFKYHKIVLFATSVFLESPKTFGNRCGVVRKSKSSRSRVAGALGGRRAVDTAPAVRVVVNGNGAAATKTQLGRDENAVGAITSRVVDGSGGVVAVE